MVGVAQVIVDVRTRQVDRPFDYLIPDRLAVQLEPGYRVYVPFGKQFCQGYVLSTAETDTPREKLKPILFLLDEQPLFTRSLLSLHDYVRDRTICTHLEALQVMVPGAYRARAVRRYRAVPERQPALSIAAAERLWRALAERPLTFEQIVGRYGPDGSLYVETWLQTAAVEEIVDGEDVVRARQVAVLRPVMAAEEVAAAAAARSTRAPKQAHLLNQLATAGAIQLRDADLRPSDPAVRAVVRDGLAELTQMEVYRSPLTVDLPEHQPRRDLTPVQTRAVESILAAVRKASGEGVLVHGVTGSGKTEVYLQAIEQCLADGGGAIVLVPEISLTPQMVSRFTSRFGAHVAVLHSALSAGERRDEWLRIRRKEARVVIGARSAVFAPVDRLHLIVVDEAHELSYKQEESPHYDAREVAQWRAQAEGAAVVYGSATPSMEQLHSAEEGKLGFVSMPFRAENQPMPSVTVVDMREVLRDGHRGLFSPALVEGLESAVNDGRQAMLFLNRRGYSAFVLCRGCGQSMQCPNCDISLTLHRSGARAWLSCHYCDYRQDATEVCEHCGEPAMRPFGLGTQQIEQAVRDAWPDWRVLRMDVDTTRRKGSHQAAIKQVLEGKVDVLLGTQMIAKGLDFPNVSFVGVVAADTMLNVPDFRAAERTFSLLTQVIGRAGRSSVPGHTVIQTYRPEHYAVRAAAGHDFAGFYHTEQAFRKAFDYPPYCEITVFSASHSQASYAQGAAARFERELRRTLSPDDGVILPASPAGVTRAKGQYRYQVVVKYSQWEVVRRAMRDSLYTVSERMRPLGGTCSLDVNAFKL